MMWAAAVASGIKPSTILLPKRLKDQVQVFSSESTLHGLNLQEF